MTAIKKIRKKIASIQVKKYCAKGYRKISHRKGYGVHSPFVYSLITKTIEERAAYYKYADIKEAHSKIKNVLGNKTPVKRQSLKASKLLFRLAVRFMPKTILECGTSYGVSTIALRSAAPEAALVIIEPDSHIMDVAVKILHGTDIRGGSYEEGLKRYFSYCTHPDFIYIRNQVSEIDYQDIFSSIRDHISENAVIIVEGIRINKNIYRLFCEFTAQERIKVVMDLYDIGILIASPKLNKERYKESF